MNPCRDLVGQRFTRLVVLRRAVELGGRVKWHCRCDCGNETVALTSNLNRGGTKSCGCLRASFPNEVNLPPPKHGLFGTPLYNLWAGIKHRCYDENSPAYPRYGGRGIRVYEGWLHDAEAFASYILAELGPRPKGMQLDRIDNDKGYEPGNVRWATPSQNGRNKSNTKIITWRGRRMPLLDAMEEAGCTLNPVTVHSRLKVGWSVEDALLLPADRSLNNRHAKAGPMRSRVTPSASP